jgi:hypothetical protein
MIPNALAEVFDAKNQAKPTGTMTEAPTEPEPATASPTQVSHRRMNHFPACLSFSEENAL